MNGFDAQLTIRTRRLVLRPFGPQDAQRITGVVEAGHRFLPPGAPGHVSGVRQWLRYGVHELQRSGQGIHLAMELATEAEARIVGAISLFKTQWGIGVTEVGYGVHPVHRGRGYAPEAVTALAGRVFADYGIRRIELRANLDNAASLRVAEKAGFVREGVLRSAGQEDDGPRDLVVFGLLRDDLADPRRPGPGSAPSAWRPRASCCAPSRPPTPTTSWPPPRTRRSGAG
ncbi:GNAT family N-acetyltransferase [Thermocatellispora tengchongensis]|uniref:GNAT family N-acetyltransferase n=1 Tax=Thermocatellispora tengchongensis TaxID=1073253 RepID=UPI003625B68F